MRLQLKGRKWALSAQGLPGFTALGAPHWPLPGTGLFGNVRMLGNSRAEINHTAVLISLHDFMFSTSPDMTFCCLTANP